MVLPPDRTPTFTRVGTSSSSPTTTPTTPTTPTTGKKPSNYSTLRYSPPKRGTGTYVVNQQVQSRTRIISIRSTGVGVTGAVAGSPGSPKKKNEPTKTPPTPRQVLTPKTPNSSLATPDNFDLGSSSDSGTIKDVITTQPRITKKSLHEDISVSTPLLKTDTEVIGGDNSGTFLRGQANNVRIVSNSNPNDFRYGNGIRGEKPRDNNKDNNQCCDCLFNCFECVFVIL